jgi:hypothetical protein
VLEAPVVKHRRRGHVVAVTTQAVCGEPNAIAVRLASRPTSTTVHTSDVAREHLPLRQHNRRLTRKTHGVRKELTGLETQLWLSLASEHLVLPHESLRQPLPIPEPTRGQGSKRRGKPVTPARAAGITEHVWTTQERLSYRVPAFFLDRRPAVDHVFQPIKDTRQGR